MLIKHNACTYFFVYFDLNKLDVTQYYITSQNFISQLCLFFLHHVLYFIDLKYILWKPAVVNWKHVFSTLQEYTGVYVLSQKTIRDLDKSLENRNYYFFYWGISTFEDNCPQERLYSSWDKKYDTPCAVWKQNVSFFSHYK